MMHRRCKDRVQELEAELRTASARIADRDREAAKLRIDLENQTGARWDAAGQVEGLREQLYEARTRVLDLEQELREYREPLEVRRTRAVSHAIARGHLDFARAVLALPLAAFNPDPQLVHPGYSPEWLLDGQQDGQLATEQRLERRYGLTETEAKALLDRLSEEYVKARRREEYDDEDAPVVI